MESGKSVAFALMAKSNVLNLNEVAKEIERIASPSLQNALDSCWIENIFPRSASIPTWQQTVVIISGGRSEI